MQFFFPQFYKNLRYIKNQTPGRVKTVTARSERKKGTEISWKHCKKNKKIKKYSAVF